MSAVKVIMCGPEESELRALKAWRYSASVETEIDVASAVPAVAPTNSDATKAAAASSSGA
jgi:hypothetical protein